MGEYRTLIISLSFCLILILVIVGCENMGGIQPIGLNQDCTEKAKEFIPKYYFLKTNDFSSQLHGGDVVINEVCFGKGEKEGENINYYYPRRHCPLGIASKESPFFEYSKMVTDEQGKVLGYNKFDFDVVLKEIDNPLRIQIDYIPEWTNRYQTNYNKFDIIIRWNGFTKEVKNIFNTSTLTIVPKNWHSSSKPILQEKLKTIVSVESEGQVVYSFENDEVPAYALTETEIEIQPDLAKNIYEVIDYRIENCNWVS